MQEKSMKRFWIVFIGQLLSEMGSSISSFGLSVWVLIQSNSTIYFTITYMATMLPNVIFSPITGSISDRKNRKKVIIICDTLDAILKLMIIFLFLTGNFKIWMVILFNFLSSTLGAFQGPAFYASIPLIVPKEELDKGNSMLMLKQALRSLLAPVIAGFLYSIIGLVGLFIIDFITYFAAIITILPQNLKHKIQEKTEDNFYKTIKNDFIETFKYLFNMGAFIKILLTTTLLNFVLNLVFPLFGPLVISNYDAKIYGIVESGFGIGMIVGSVISGMLKTKSKVKSIYKSLFIVSIFIMTIGFSPKWYFILMGTFLFALPIPRINALFGSLMHSKISNDMLGKTSAVIMGINNIFSPVAVLLSGVLAEYIFNPILVEGGSLSNTMVGTLIGVGKTRGIGLMFIIAGLIMSFIAIISLKDRNIMSFEKEIPDIETE